MRAAVLGSGSWGSALAKVLSDRGHHTTLWGRRPELAESIEQTRENGAFLPGARFADTLRATSDLGEALDGAELLLVAVPTHGLREVLHRAEPLCPKEIPVVSATKGIEQDTLAFVNDLVAEELPWSAPYFVALSGPSFAREVAEGLPTVVVAAARDLVLAREVQQAFWTEDRFRIYLSDDLLGVEIGGALKNVVALAAGAVAGARLGASTQAALVTRGFVELRRLAASFGARPETLMGLSGLGDLILTCSSAQSRNFAYGMALGRGEPLAGLPLAEGVATARIAAELARERGVAAPIIDATRALLDGETTMQDAAAALMARPLRSEDE